MSDQQGSDAQMTDEQMAQVQANAERDQRADEVEEEKTAQAPADAPDR